MSDSPFTRAPLIGLLAIVVLTIAVTACGDDATATPTSAPVVTTSQDDAGGDGGTTSGGSGTATVTVSAGTFELEVEEACVISDIGIGAIASSAEASLFIAGPGDLAVVGFELSSGDMWSAAPAAVEIDGTTMSYEGTAMGPGASDSTISVQVFCDDVVSGPGG